MWTEYDEKKGLVKTNWEKIRDRVMAVEPRFAKIVDKINPSSKNFPLYLAYFPYGALKGDTKNVFLPHLDGSSYLLSEEDDFRCAVGFHVAKYRMHHSACEFNPRF